MGFPVEQLHTDLLSFLLGAWWRGHSTLLLIVGWVAGMWNYHEYMRVPSPWYLSTQLLSVICLMGLLVYGVTQGQWWNFLVVPVLAWLQIQLTKRWSTRPGAWW